MSNPEHPRPEVASPGDGPELRITNVPEPLSVDQNRRMRGYLIKMTVRVACFLASFLSWQLGWPIAVTLLLIAAAAVLPYFAVISVNTGRDGRDVDTSFLYSHVAERQLGAASTPDIDPDESAGTP